MQKCKNDHSAASEPINEHEQALDMGGVDSNAGEVNVVTVKSTAMVAKDAPFYFNAIDLTPKYLFLLNQAGYNISPTGNAGRSGLAAYRVRARQDGQGDVYAFNASIVVSGRNPRARHWRASPAGVLFGGSVLGAADGAYLNPFEIHVSDKPHDRTFNCSAVGAVFKLNRHQRAGNSFNQVWAGLRVLSKGPQPVENMLSGTGKFVTGLDLSMPALSFGPARAAIAVKAGDRFYCNAQALASAEGGVSVGDNWVMTHGFGEYSEYDADRREWLVVLGGRTALAVRKDTTTINSLSVAGKVSIFGKQVENCQRMKGPEDYSALLHTEHDS